MLDVRLFRISPYRPATNDMKLIMTKKD